MSRFSALRSFLFRLFLAIVSVVGFQPAAIRRLIQTNSVSIFSKYKIAHYILKVGTRAGRGQLARKVEFGEK